MTTTQKVLLTVLGIIALVLLARYVVFKKDFEEWGQGLERIEDWQTDYKQQNPNATEEQMDADFNAGISNIEKWEADYKAKNPDATDAEVKAAFEAMWSTK